MTTLIEKIELFEKELKGLLPMKPEYRQRLDKKIRLEFNYNSNHIEGNTLTYGETELLLIFGKTTGNHDIREYDEMKAHDAAFELIHEWATDNERPLTEMALKNLHKILLVEPFWKEALTPDGQPTRRLIKVGDYKEQPNSVRLQTGEMFHYASPAETPIKTGELVEWYRNEEEKKELHPVVLAALLHYKFVLIHPFDDGNGRISRLLMNYVLLKHNLPPVIVKSADKRNYLFALNQADTGDINAFLSYIAEQLIWSLELYIKAAKGETLEEDDDLQKEIAVWKKKEVAKKSPLRRNDGLVILYKNSLKQLFEFFSKQNEQFFELFQEVEPDFFGLREIEEEINRAVGNETKIYNLYGNIRAAFEFREYKFNENNPFSIRSNLIVNLQPYKYNVQFNQKEILERRYDECLTSEEINQIVSDCIKDVFNQIKTEAEK